MQTGPFFGVSDRRSLAGGSFTRYARRRMTSTNPNEPQAYEPPSATVLGTLADLTQGRPGPKSDGINPGSKIKR
jgi:hypothetical protein